MTPPPSQNGCGGTHRYWECPKPLSADLRAGKKKYDGKQQVKRAHKPEANAEEPEKIA